MDSVLKNRKFVFVAFCWLKFDIIKTFYCWWNASKGVDDGINMVYISIIGLEAKCGACKWCEGIFARYYKIDVQVILIKG